MEPEITDIFDRIMNWKLLRFKWPFYKKNKDKLLAYPYKIIYILYNRFLEICSLFQKYSLKISCQFYRLLFVGIIS